MYYCTRVAPTTSTTDDADGTSANVTLNTKAKRILYIGGYEVDVTHTAAEGRHMSAIITGDAEYGGTVSRIPLGSSRHASFVGGDSLSGHIDAFFPVDWASGPNAILTANTRGIGGTAAEEADIFILYSSGEAHFPMPIWGGHGLTTVPRWYIRSDLTAITNSTTETGGNAVTKPVKASGCVGFAGVAIIDGTVVAADEMNTRMRLTANGALVEQFEPDQVWPVNGGSRDAGLQGLANASVDGDAFDVNFFPVQFKVGVGGTITPNWNMRSAVTNAVEHYFYAAFV